MMEMVVKFGIDIEKERKKKLPHDLVRFHFTSKRKRMSTLVENLAFTDTGYDKRIHMKGAAEIVLGACTHYLN
jgi:magnesium-transporting ATPase (P-type)